jgi:prephenate dehydrogenase
MKLALGRGVIQRAEADLGAAVRGVDVVILATPIMAMKEAMRQMASHLRPGAVVTDTASTKVLVMEWAEECLPASVSFVGGHPMAGKETWGIESAEAALFRGATYCLIPASGVSSEVVERVVGMVGQVGARPLFIEAREHDHLVAAVSHLPILISAALVSATTRSPSWPQMAELAATGYRDLTRLASGRPEMSRDICLSNKGAVLSWLNRFMEELQAFKHLVDEGGGEGQLEEAFSRVREARERWLGERG